MTDQRWMDYRMEEAVWRPDSESCLQFSLIKSTPGGFIASFGVGSGESLNFLADLTDETVHGFDTFPGSTTDSVLEPVALMSEGSQSRSSSMTSTTLENRGRSCPAIDWRELRFAFNTCLWPGSLCETLPLFLDEVRAPARFVHLNCHCYQTTREALFGLETRIVRGTVVQFEWLWNYPDWQQGAFRALREFAAATGQEFRFLARTSGAQVTVMFR